MADEVQTPDKVEAPAQVAPTQAAPAQNNEPEVLQGGTLATLKMLSGFTSPETQVAIQNAGKKPADVKDEKKEVVPPGEKVDKKEGGEKPLEGEKKEIPVKKEDEKKEDKKEEIEEPARKSVLGLGKKEGKKGDVVIETPEHILEVVKSKFGQEIKDIKGLPKFFESAEKWRADSQKVESVEKENTQFKDLWENQLPQEFLDAAVIHLKGGDYREAFANIPKFDFNKKADKQDKEELVNHYFPNEFSKEDFEEKEPSQSLKIATKAAIDKFNVEKQTRESQRAVLAEKSQKLIEAQKTALNSSVKVLKQRFPDMEPDNLNEVKSLLEGGPSKVISLLYNNDGTAKTDAAVRLTMALYGDEEIQTALQKQEKKIETKINEDLVSRGADGPKPKQQSGSPAEKIDPEIKKQIDDLKRSTRKNVFG